MIWCDHTNTSTQTEEDAERLWNHGGPGANTAWDGTVAAVTYAEAWFAASTACVSTTLLNDVEDWSEETEHGADHVERWLRVLHTFKGTANDATIMLSADARTYVSLNAQRWQPVVTAIECLEARALEDALAN